MRFILLVSVPTLALAAAHLTYDWLPPGRFLQAYRPLAKDKIK